MVWHHSLLLMNSFNKTEAAVFSCRLCFLRAFPFISFSDHFHLDDLRSYDGVNVLIHFLDEHLAKDDLTDSLEKFEDFEDFKKLDGQTIAEFVSMFDVKYRKIEKKKMTLPFKLLRKANIFKEEKLLVLTGMNFDN